MAVPKRQRNNIFVKIKQFRYPHGTISILHQSHRSSQPCIVQSRYTRFFLLISRARLQKNYLSGCTTSTRTVPRSYERLNHSITWQRASSGVPLLHNCGSIQFKSYLWLHCKFAPFFTSANYGQLKFTATWDFFFGTSCVQSPDNLALSTSTPLDTLTHIVNKSSYQHILTTVLCDLRHALTPALPAGGPNRGMLATHALLCAYTALFAAGAQVAGTTQNLYGANIASNQYRSYCAYARALEPALCARATHAHCTPHSVVARFYLMLNSYLVSAVLLPNTLVSALDVEIVPYLCGAKLAHNLTLSAILALASADICTHTFTTTVDLWLQAWAGAVDTSFYVQSRFVDKQLLLSVTAFSAIWSRSAFNLLALSTKLCSRPQVEVLSLPSFSGAIVARCSTFFCGVTLPVIRLASITAAYKRNLAQRFFFLEITYPLLTFFPALKFRNESAKVSLHVRHKHFGIPTFKNKVLFLTITWPCLITWKLFYGMYHAPLVWCRLRSKLLGYWHVFELFLGAISLYWVWSFKDATTTIYRVCLRRFKIFVRKSLITFFSYATGARAYGFHKLLSAIPGTRLLTFLWVFATHTGGQVWRLRRFLTVVRYERYLRRYNRLFYIFFNADQPYTRDTPYVLDAELLQQSGVGLCVYYWFRLEPRTCLLSRFGSLQDLVGGITQSSRASFLDISAIENNFQHIHKLGMRPSVAAAFPNLRFLQELQIGLVCKRRATRIVAHRYTVASWVNTPRISGTKHNGVLRYINPGSLTTSATRTVVLRSATSLYVLNLVCGVCLSLLRKKIIATPSRLQQRLKLYNPQYRATAWLKHKLYKKPTPRLNSLLTFGLFTIYGKQANNLLHYKLTLWYTSGAAKQIIHSRVCALRHGWLTYNCQNVDYVSFVRLGTWWHMWLFSRTVTGVRSWLLDEETSYLDWGNLSFYQLDIFFLCADDATAFLQCTFEEHTATAVLGTRNA